MAIRFVDKPPGVPPRKTAPTPVADDAARADGEARFATPIETARPVNPDAAGQLPFAELPQAEKTTRGKRTRSPASPRK